jgi:hypothetical protein
MAEVDKASGLMLLAPAPPRSGIHHSDFSIAPDALAPLLSLPIKGQRTRAHEQKRHVLTVPTPLTPPLSGYPALPILREGGLGPFLALVIKAKEAALPTNK